MILLLLVMFGMLQSSTDDGDTVKAVVHRGVVRDDVIEWETTVSAAGRGPVMFVQPLDRKAEIDGAEALGDDGKVRGFQLDALLGVVRVTVRTQQPKQDTLLPPLVDTRAVQKVIVEGGPLQFSPLPSTGLEMQLGGFATRSVRHGDRELVDRPSSHGERALRPMYLRVQDLDVTRGIQGEFKNTQMLKLEALAGAAVIAIFVVVALLVIYRRLRRDADAERADRIINAEFGPL